MELTCVLFALTVFTLSVSGSSETVGRSSHLHSKEKAKNTP